MMDNLKLSQRIVATIRREIGDFLSLAGNQHYYTSKIDSRMRGNSNLVSIDEGSCILSMGFL